MGTWQIVRNGPTPLVLASGQVPAATSYELSLTVEGDTVSAAVDGSPVVSLTDATYTTGLAGLGSLGYYPVRYAAFGVG